MLESHVEGKWKVNSVFSSSEIPALGAMDIRAFKEAKKNTIH